MDTEAVDTDEIRVIPLAGMDDALKVLEDVVIPASEMWFTASRSGGPGGQHVNTTSSRVTLHWDVANTSALGPSDKAPVMARLAGRISHQGVLQVDVDTERSQHQNRQTARKRLAEIVQKALTKPKKRVPTKIPESAKERRRQDKAKRGVVKQQRAPPECDD